MESKIFRSFSRSLYTSIKFTYSSEKIIITKIFQVQKGFFSAKKTQIKRFSCLFPLKGQSISTDFKEFFPMIKANILLRLLLHAHLSHRSKKNRLPPTRITRIHTKFESNVVYAKQKS